MSTQTAVSEANRRPPASSELIPLSALVHGEARVVRVDAEPDDAVRLMALGICVGRRIQIVKTGDPLIVRVVGARVGLSARLAAGVFVTTAQPAAGATTAA